MMSDTLKDIERLADINDHLRRQLDKSNEIILELNHMVAKQAGEIASLRQQVAELQAWKASVPVIALYRYVYNEYEKSLPGTAPVDLKQINTWFDKVQPT